MSTATDYQRRCASYAGFTDAEIDAAEAIDVNVRSEMGYHYSSYTFEDPSISVWVSMKDPNGPGNILKIIDGPDAVAELIRSFAND
jgi:hypothetical protein